MAVSYAPKDDKVGPVGKNSTSVADPSAIFLALLTGVVQNKGIAWFSPPAATIPNVQRRVAEIKRAEAAILDAYQNGD